MACKRLIPAGSWLVVLPQRFAPGYALVHVFDGEKEAREFYTCIRIAATQETQDILLCRVVDTKVVTGAGERI
ncbi:MAG: hypothetical protein AB1776_00130 [Bacillota bacterium]